MEKELGKGGKGVVLLVRHVLDSVSLGKFACKRVPVGELLSCAIPAKLGFNGNRKQSQVA
jgi:hypothetical protein